MMIMTTVEAEGTLLPVACILAEATSETSKDGNIRPFTLPLQSLYHRRYPDSIPL